MKIKKLEINNFRGFRQATVEFPESNLAVFIGVNGQGKSSLLDLVAGFLSYFTEKWSSFEEKNIPFMFNFSDIHKLSKDTKNQIFLSIEGYPEDVNPEGVKTLNLVILGDEKKGDFTVYRNDHSALIFTENMDIKVMELEKVSFPILLYFRSNRFFKDSVKDYEKTKVFGYPSQFSAFDNAISQEITQFNDFFDWFRIEEDKENELIKKERNFDLINQNLQPVRKAVTTFFTKLNGFSFTNLHVERDLPKSRNFTLAGFSSSLIVSKEGQDFHLEQLSDGEKMLLMMVCDIARRLTIANPSLPDPLEGRGIVLIDEIELHLHPKWQREVIPALLATFPNIQFLLSTHSPQVLSSVDSEDIFLLKDGEVFKLSSNPKGMDTNAILEEVMDTPKYPKHMAELVEKLFTLVQKRQFGPAMEVRQQIVEETSPDYPILRQADSMMERLKILS